jgi:energy-coupling factor transporter ATP-binding protein EcfA2
MTAPFPFSAMVGQEAMKRAMVLTAIDPAIGGVLVFGDRGTGKSTAVRALAALLPPIDVVEGCPVNSARMADVPDWVKTATGKTITRPTPVIDLPLGATEDRVVGALDIERALTRGEKAFEAGLLARATQFRDAHTTTIDSAADFYAFFTPQNSAQPEIHGGFVLAHWDGTSETEEKIKDDLKVTIRCIPRDANPEAGVCPFSGRPSARRVVWAKSY